jgi:hypothetical protein
MVKDFKCKKCDLSFSVGWYHYGKIDQYSGGTLFICGQCGSEHSIIHPTLKGKEQGCLEHYAHARERPVKGGGYIPIEMDERLFENREFKGFDSFICPACFTMGKVITEESVENDPPQCPLCQEPMELESSWIT